MKGAKLFPGRGRFDAKVSPQAPPALYYILQFLKDPTDVVDNADHDQFMARIRSLPQPVFRYPPSLWDLEQRENIIKSSRSSETGDSQGEPLAILASVQTFSLI